MACRSLRATAARLGDSEDDEGVGIARALTPLAREFKTTLEQAGHLESGRLRADRARACRPREAGPRDRGARDARAADALLRPGRDLQHRPRADRRALSRKKGAETPPTKATRRAEGDTLEPHRARQARAHHLEDEAMGVRSNRGSTRAAAEPAPWAVHSARWRCRRPTSWRKSSGLPRPLPGTSAGAASTAIRAIATTATAGVRPAASATSTSWCTRASGNGPSCRSRNREDTEPRSRSRGGDQPVHDARRQAHSGQDQVRGVIDFTIAPCSRKAATIVVDVGRSRACGKGREGPGRLPTSTTASSRRSAICGSKGCDVRPVRIAVSDSDRDCSPYEMECSFYCCFVVQAEPESVRRLVESLTGEALRAVSSTTSGTTSRCSDALRRAS